MKQNPRYRQMPPLVVRHSIHLDKLEGAQKKLAEKVGSNNDVRSLSVNVFDADDILLTTEYVAYYLQIGLHVYDVTEVYCFQTSKQFMGPVITELMAMREANRGTNEVRSLFTSRSSLLRSKQCLAPCTGRPSPTSTTTRELQFTPTSTNTSPR